MLIFVLTLACLLSSALADGSCLNEVWAVYTGYPVIYSSVNPGVTECSFPRLDGENKAWCAGTNDQNQWIQVSSINLELWVGTVIQGKSNRE
jgi:hypothetical protein